MKEDDDWTSSMDSVVPLGRLRIEAHELFDPLWKSGRVKRKRAYFILAREMGVPEPQAHFKQMDREALGRAIPAIRRVRARYPLPG